MIQATRLTKEYGSARALEDASFSIGKGEVVGLLGLNGAGKSTTMNILAGCLAPSDGSVLIGGINMAKSPAEAKRKIGYLPEIPPLYGEMKVGEFLSFAFALKKLKGNKQEAVFAAAARAGVEAMLGRIIRNLSKGYRQRVGLATALLGEPPVLILDEPTAGLDPSQIHEVRNLISQLGRERTVILSSHILSEIKSVCERVIVLNQGRIVADDTPMRLENAMRGRRFSVLVEGPPELVLTVLGGVPSIAEAACLEERESGVWEYRLRGREGADVRRELFRALATADLPLLCPYSSDGALEDIFLRLVGRGGGDEDAS